MAEEYGPETWGNNQTWPDAAGARNWETAPEGATYPTIAIIDSGVEPGRSEFGSRLLTQVNFVSDRRQLAR